MGGQEGEEGEEAQGEEEEAEEEEEGEEEEEAPQEEEGEAGHLREGWPQEGRPQEQGLQGVGQGARCGAEEGGEGPLQGEDVLFGPRVHYRQEKDELRRRREGGLGVHQEEGAQQRAQRQGGWRGFRRRLDVQALGRHPEAPEVSALVVWSWISCRSYRAPAEARSDVYARGFGGDLE